MTFALTISPSRPRATTQNLDSAKMASEPGKQFKGIGVLQVYPPNNPHIYRYNLESFLYIYLPFPYHLSAANVSYPRD